HKLDKDAFWTVCDHKAWAHPYDAAGVRVGFGDTPKAIADLADDPYRSLAGELRRAGGFAKDTTPFSEFLWADFLRRNVKAKRIESDFSQALEAAMSHAKSPDAAYLPGWCGPAE
ncbi:MAG TPA: ParB-like protein, partial [Methylobacterium sp.]|nr:ParB-like protein [Methylobacterium sp.]